MNEIRLFSYKMTHDTGFAPNPFHDILTLANCKPQIRKSKRINDWIAGFTSSQLSGDSIGYERLVYLMKVTEKVDYSEYWNNPRFKAKIPILSSDNIVDKAGDNIYMPVSPIGFKQIPNKNHNESNFRHDLNGKYILISDEFYYFGNSAIIIPNRIRPKVPRGQSGQGVRTHNLEKAMLFIEYIKKNYTKGLFDYPHNWPKRK